VTRSTLISMAKYAIIPAGVVTYVAISGTTGSCPACTAIVNAVTGRGGQEAAAAPAPGLAPSIAGIHGVSLDGQSVALEDLLEPGKPMIVDLWATWCGPCRAQRHTFKKMGEDLSELATLVAMSVDRGSDVVKSFISTHGSDATELMATPEAIRAFGSPAGIPTLVFISSDGQIRDVVTGAQSAGRLKKRLAAID